MCGKEQEELRPLLCRGSSKMGIPLDEQTVEQLLIYIQELHKWNQRINLIARKTSPADIVEKHFLDSMTLLPFLGRHRSRQETLLDVGTGAGFPGLVLATALPDLQVILVEPRMKRVSFLRHIIRFLSLVNVEVIGERLESVPELYTRNIDYVTSRAVADPVVFFPMVVGFLERGASILFMFSRHQRQKLKIDDPVPGMILEESRNFILPFSGTERTVCRVRQKR